MLSTSSLVNLIARFESLNAECEQHLEDLTGDEEDVKALVRRVAEAFDTYSQIKLAMSDTSCEHIGDHHLRDTARKIRDGAAFCAVGFYTALTGRSSPAEAFEQDAYNYLVEGDWTNVLDLHESATQKIRRAKVGCLLLLLTQSSLVRPYFAEIRESFASGLFKATVALCRAMLEIVLYEALMRRGLLEAPNTTDVQTELPLDHTLHSMIRKATRREARLLSADDKIEAKEIKSAANFVLHRVTPQLRFSEAGEDEASEIVKKTVRLVEILHERMNEPVGRWR